VGGLRNLLKGAKLKLVAGNLAATHDATYRGREANVAPRVACKFGHRLELARACGEDQVTRLHLSDVELGKSGKWLRLLHLFPFFS
jgi:hypothetical protein